MQSSNDNSRQPQDAEASAADLYRLVHRGLRWGLSRALLGLGSVDLDDPEACADVLQEVVTIAELCARHVRHEEDFIHQAIARVSPTLLESLEREHQDHFAQIDDLKRRALALRYGTERPQTASTIDDRRLSAAWKTRAPRGGREYLRQDLYLRLSSFMAENLEHMRQEEEIVQPMLDANYSVSELTEIHMRLVQSIPFDELVLFLRIMLPAVALEKRLELLSGPKAGMPPQVFAALLWQSSTHLSDRERAVLVERLEEAA